MAWLTLPTLRRKSLSEQPTLSRQVPFFGVAFRIQLGAQLYQKSTINNYLLSLPALAMIPLSVRSVYLSAITCLIGQITPVPPQPCRCIDARPDLNKSHCRLPRIHVFAIESPSNAKTFCDFGDKTQTMGAKNSLRVLNLQVGMEKEAPELRSHDNIALTSRP